MVSRFRSWWQQIKQHRVAIGVVGIELVVVISLIISVVWFNGTGFDGYNQVTTAHTLNGPSAGTVVRTEVYQPGKSLWDWLQLLIIPVVLAVGGFLLNYTMSRNEREATEKRDQTERDVALDNQREAALQAYIDSMSELLLEKKLRESGEDDEVRMIARVRTLTVLPRLDGERKGSVLQFLYEAGLINKDKCIIDLRGANLKGTKLVIPNLNSANLRETNLREARLVGADLSGADLSHANLYAACLTVLIAPKMKKSESYVIKTRLRGADLSWANLNDADLSGADLSGADLSGASLQEANLSGADLSGACLRKAVLNRADFYNFKIVFLGYPINLETNLKGANLIEADLSGANLSRVDLSGTDLRGATLRRANLSEANLTDTNLKGAIGITIEELEKQAESLKGATMPDGSTHA